MKDKPLILVTNDDGMFAPGIKALVEIAKDFGEVCVVAPNSPQSAKGHAVTLHKPIRLNKVDVFDDVPAWECSGTPVDCVKIAKHHVLREREIDLCVSGINHGSNASVNIIYSGTLSAAMEAAFEGIESIGFSYLDYSFEADFSQAKKAVRSLIGHVIQNGIKDTNLLNVNIPNTEGKPLQGIKVCRQAKGKWVEEFQEGTDPRGQKYYWLGGNFVEDNNLLDTDLEALEEGYVSVVPSDHDMTKHTAINLNKEIEKLNL